MTGAPPEKTTQKSAAKRQRERRKQREEHLIKRQDFRTRLTILPIAGFIGGVDKEIPAWPAPCADAGDLVARGLEWSRPPASWPPGNRSRQIARSPTTSPASPVRAHIFPANPLQSGD